MEHEADGEPIDLSETQELVIRAKQGEEQAFADLYARHAGRVRHSAAARLGGYAVADLEDVVQETFLYAFGVLREGGFDAQQSPGGFRNWLAKIAVNKATDGIRKAKAQRRGAGREKLMRDIMSSSSAELHLPSPLARPSETLHLRELEARVGRVLGELSARHRQIIDLRDHCEMSFAEIAAELEGSPATLRSLYKRAKDELRERLERLGLEAS